MERATWTDERLDDLSSEVRELRREMRTEFADVRTEMRAGFAELRGGVRGEVGSVRTDLSGQIEGLRLTIMRVGGAMLVALLGVIAAILARGV